MTMLTNAFNFVSNYGWTLWASASWESTFLAAALLLPGAIPPVAIRMINKL